MYKNFNQSQRNHLTSLTLFSPHKHIFSTKIIKIELNNAQLKKIELQKILESGNIIADIEVSDNYQKEMDSKKGLSAMNVDQSVESNLVFSNGHISRVLGSHGMSICSIVVQLDHEYFGSAGWNGKVNVYRKDDGSQVREIQCHTAKIWLNSLQKISDDIIVTGSEEGSNFKAWNWRTGNLIKILNEHKGIVYCFEKVSQTRFLSGSQDRGAILWSVPEFEVIQQYDLEHTRDIGILKALNQEQFLSGSDDQTIKLWQYDSDKSLFTFAGHKDVLLALERVSDTRFLSGAGSLDYNIKFWDTQLKEMLFSIKLNEGNSIYRIHYFPSQEKFCVCDNISITFWDIKTLKKAQNVINFPNIEYVQLNCEVFSDKQIAIINKNMDIYLYDLFY